MYSGPVIDVDVHHQPDHDSELLPYVPRRSREAVRAMLERGTPLDARGALPFVALSNGGNRLDTIVEGGPRSGASYEMLRDQCLDPWGTVRCLLTYNVGEHGSHLNPYVSTDLCRAANDWTIDCWLERDPRLYTGITVSGMLPDEAAQEVARLAGHPRMACVLLSGNPLARPLGDPLYHPIYAAAAEAGLPIATHVGLAVPASVRAVGGTMSTASEFASAGYVAGCQHVSSFIVHGVFEKFPNLRLILNEFGLSWLPTVMWNLDREVDLLRTESPWVKRLPSEYIRGFMKLSTQPLETSTDGRALIELLATVDGIEDIICFSSDYPHYTMDDFNFAARVLPDEWYRKAFFENGRDVLGWHDLSAQANLMTTVGA
jgi:hypothetical protein